MRLQRAAWVGSALAAGSVVLALPGRGGDSAARAAGLRESAPVDCAFKRIRPCPAAAVDRFTLHGPYLARSTTPQGLRIRFTNFGGQQARSLAGVRVHVGRIVHVVVGASTKIRIVQPNQASQPGTRAQLHTALSNYDSAPVYVTGRLSGRSRLDDRLVSIVANQITLDLSGGARANLVGQWRIEHLPGWNLVLAYAQDSPPTWFGDVTDASGRAEATVAFTQPASGYVCAAVFRANERRSAGFECGPIGDSAARLGPITPLQRGDVPAVLVRMP